MIKIFSVTKETWKCCKSCMIWCTSLLPLSQDAKNIYSLSLCLNLVKQCTRKQVMFCREMVEFLVLIHDTNELSSATLICEAQVLSGMLWQDARMFPSVSQAGVSFLESYHHLMSSHFYHCFLILFLPTSRHLCFPLCSILVNLVCGNDYTIGWQNWNLLSHPNATLAPLALQAKGRWWNF